VFRARGPSQLGPFPVQSPGERHDLFVEFSPDEQIRPEGVGLDAISAGFEEGLVDLLDHVRPAASQNFGTILATLPIFGLAIRTRLKTRSHGTIDHEDPTIQFSKKRTRSHDWNPDQVGLWFAGSPSDPGPKPLSSASNTNKPFIRING
jgi:hypothetical protein